MLSNLYDNFTQISCVSRSFCRAEDLHPQPIDLLKNIAADFRLQFAPHFAEIWRARGSIVAVRTEQIGLDLPQQRAGTPPTQQPTEGFGIHLEQAVACGQLLHCVLPMR